MVKKSKDVVKDVVKSKAASKATFGTDPNDPWSAKANIDENVTSRRADLLSKFYKSRGWNVNYITKNKKVSQSKTGDYDKWKRDHGIYESGDVCSHCQVDPCICDDSHGFVDKEQVTESKRMSAAVKLQRAWEKQRAKSDASKKRGDEYMAQIRQQVADKEKKEVKEDNFPDPKAATQCAFDGANSPDDTIPSKKMSKAAKMVKELHGRKITEDMYDWEKSDKQGEQYGKAPKVKKTEGVNELGDTKPNARMVLKGGTTLTGQERDMVEIDPMLKNRTSMPDYKSMDQKKTKPQEQ
jgi:hypothetical protein